jgi:sensor histidine kinase YesM
MKAVWYKKKWMVVLMHAGVWILLFSLPYLLRPSYDPNAPVHHPHSNETYNFIAYRINDLTLIAFFYFNALLLIPRLFYKKKNAFYFLAITICFGLLFLEGWWVMNYIAQFDTVPSARMQFVFSVFAFLFILASSIAYRTIKDKIEADNFVKERENEFLKTELSFLRSQVSPHFMFNVLNNMVALARKQSDQLEPSLIKLSSLMRYMLYETDEAKVSLEKETEYLQSYIDLQQQRFGKKVLVNVHFEKPDNVYYLEPMLLIPFVENAFKHGTGLIDHATIDIELSAKNNLLLFKVQNKYNPASKEIKDKASGIGLANVERRLQLLYRNTHQLLITKQVDLFTVTLQINLAQ